MSLKKIAPVVAAVVLALLPSAALAAEEPTQASPSPEALARQLIQLTEGGNLGKQVVAQMVASFREANPKVPNEFWTEFLTSVDPKEIEEITIPIYVKNLTPEEMSAFIQFYSSPVGQSLIHKLPVIMQESMAAGQKWGEKLARDAAERVAKYKHTHPDA